MGKYTIVRDGDVTTETILDSFTGGNTEMSITVAENILATSISKRAFNFEKLMQMNASLYMIVDSIIDNINIKEVSRYNGDKSQLLSQLLRNEMVRVSLELTHTVDEISIDKVMELLLVDIDTAVMILKRGRV